MKTLNNIVINPSRREGYLEGYKAQDIPKRLLFIDTETELVTINDTISEHKLKLGVAIYVELNKDLTVYKRKVYNFHSTKEFIAILKNYDHKKKKLYVFGHNIKFDLMVLNLPYELSIRGYENNFPIVNGMSFIWRVSLTNGEYQFLDTANYAATSLKDIGKDIGVAKMEIDFNNCTYDELRDYCENDCHICEMFIISMFRFIRDNQLGSFRVTLASQSFTAYRYRFMKTKPFITLRPDILTLERAAYHGGRTECFYIGQIPDNELYYIDVNSSYPFSMKQDIPIEPSMNLRNDGDLDGLKFAVEHHYVIAYVRLNTKINAFPYIFNNHLCFPIGEFDTALHHAELKIAIEHDLIDKVYMYQCYHKGKLFDDYVDFFFDLKEKATISGNRSERMISKLFMNSLYGKFGQTWKHTEFIEDTGGLECYVIPSKVQKTDEHFTEVCWFGKIYHSYSNGEDVYSIPSISGAITAYSRILLYNYIAICGHENVYYCDTDSIITNRIGYDRIKPYIHKTKLGYMDLEKTMTNVVINGNKDYSYDETRVLKGVPKNAIEISPQKFQYMQFEGFKQWRNRGGNSAPLLKLAVKEKRQEYNKGFVLPSGIVKPLCILGDYDHSANYYSEYSAISQIK